MTLYDKLASKKLPKHRTPEATLLWVGALGGAFVMYVTMQLVRHKTQHRKFMIGLPLLMLLQVLLAVLAAWVSVGGFIGSA